MKQWNITIQWYQYHRMLILLSRFNDINITECLYYYHDSMISISRNAYIIITIQWYQYHGMLISRFILWKTPLPSHGYVGVIGADVCEAPNRHPGARNALRQPSKLSQRGGRVLRLAGTAISYTKKNPLSAHHIGILRAQKRVKLVLFGCRVLRHGKGTKKIREIVKNLQKNST